MSHLCEAKQLGAIKASFAVGTLQAEAGAGSSSACSPAAFICSPHEDPVNAMGVVKVKHTVFCWAAPLLMFTIMTANEKRFLGCPRHSGGSSMHLECGLTRVIKLVTYTVIAASPSSSRSRSDLPSAHIQLGLDSIRRRMVIDRLSFFHQTFSSQICQIRTHSFPLPSADWSGPQWLAAVGQRQLISAEGLSISARHTITRCSPGYYQPFITCACIPVPFFNFNTFKSLCETICLSPFIFFGAKKIKTAFRAAL